MKLLIMVEEKNFMLGETVKHERSGGYYIYLSNAILEANLEPYSMYRSLEGREIWLRPAKEFLDGRFVKDDRGKTQR